MSVGLRLARMVIDHPRMLLAATFAITTLLCLPFRHVSFTQEDVGELDPRDPEVARFQQFQRDFGEQEFIVVAVQAEDVFRAPVLHYLDELSARFERLPEVESTDSLIRAEDVSMEQDGVHSEPLLAAIPDDPRELARLRERVLAHPYWPGSLVSTDGTLASIRVVLRRHADGHIPRVEATRGILDAVHGTKPDGVAVHVAGRGPIMVDSQDCMRGDLARFLWLTPVVIVLLLLYLLRTMAGLVVPLLVAVLAVLWTLGLFFALGNSLSLAVTMLPTLIGVLSLSDNIHLLATYQQNLSRHADRRAALLDALLHLAKACFLTSLTTAVGFGSLLFSGLLSLRAFGLWAAIGVGIAYLLSITVAPAMLAVWPAAAGHARTRRRPTLATRTLSWLARRGGAGPAMATTCLLITAVAGFGLTRLEFDSRFADSLPSDAPSVQASHLLTQKLSGTSVVEVVAEGPDWAFEEPANLQAIAAIQEQITHEPEVNWTFSLVDLLRGMNSGQGQDGDGDALTDGRDITDRLVGLSHTQLLDNLTDATRSKVCIHVRMNETGTAQQLALIQRIEDIGRARLDPSLSFHTTGTVKLFAMTSQALAIGQTRSFGLTFLSIALVMIVALRSLRLGLIALIPNAVPILVTLGLMGFTGIPFGASGVMISCVAFGIAVDDTIHFLVRYRSTPGTTNARIRRVLRTSGAGMVFTTVVNAAGFAVFGLSSFAPSRQFGLLTAFAMFAALLADLLILPQLLRWSDPARGNQLAADPPGPR